MAHAVLDSGATGNLINKRLVCKHHMKELTLPRTIDLVNANGTMSIINTRVWVNMTIGQGQKIHTKDISDILLGTNWLIKHNPNINWKNYHVKMNQCLDTCQQNRVTNIQGQQQGNTQMAL
jgi:hypothetical protein